MTGLCVNAILLHIREIRRHMTNCPKLRKIAVMTEPGLSPQERMVFSKLFGARFPPYKGFKLPTSLEEAILARIFGGHKRGGNNV